MSLLPTKEIIVNTILGVLLVSVVALPFVLAFAVFKVAGLVITTFWPQLAHSQNAIFVGFIAAGILASAIVHSRKHQWRDAFLSFVSVPMLLSIWFAGAHSPFGFNGDYWLVTFFVAFSIPPDSSPTRFNFLVAASAITAIVAVNTGLLGTGMAARIASDCVLAGLFIWFVINTRARLSDPKDPGPQAPLSPTSA